MDSNDNLLAVMKLTGTKNGICEAVLSRKSELLERTQSAYSGESNEEQKQISKTQFVMMDSKVARADIKEGRFFIELTPMKSSKVLARSKEFRLS